MAKKDKSTKVAAPAAAASNGGAAPPATDGTAAPDFSGDVLKRLQQKIRDGMDRVNAETSKPQSKNGPQGQDKVEEKAKGAQDKNSAKPAKKDQAGKPEKKEQAAKPEKKEKTPRPEKSVKPEKKEQPAKTEKKEPVAGKSEKKNKNKDQQPQPAAPAAGEPRGKKRGRDGEKSTAQPKQAESKPAVPSATAIIADLKKGNKAKSGKKSLGDDDLLKEILELGGTKEDLDLVKGLDSDDEDEVIEGQAESNDKAIRGDLEKMLAGMGFNSKKYEKEVIVSDEEVEEEEDDDDEEEDDEDDEEVVPDVPKMDTTHVKGKLVSTPISF